MAEKNKGKVDPVAIRELISQGIPMKKKESEMIASTAVEEKKNDMFEVPQETAEEVVSLKVCNSSFFSLYFHCFFILFFPAFELIYSPAICRLCFLHRHGCQ